MIVDVVIVGAGAGGAAAAFGLCEQGLSVLLLDAGPRFDPVTDYPLDAPGWERRGFPAPKGSRATIRYGDLGDLGDDDGLASFNAVAGRLGDARKRIVGAGYSHVMGVGGSTLHYTGEAHRMHPDALRLNTLTGMGTDWPLDYAALEPFYTRVEHLIGVAGPEDTGARWRSAPYPLPPHPLGPAALRLVQAGAAHGLTFQPNARAALSEPYEGRPACNYCAQCQRGCPLGDKGSADVTFLPKAQATGRLTLIADAPVVALHTGANGRIVALDYIHDGARTRQETPVLVLAGGAVQTPRLLLAQRDADHPQGLANGSGQVGRNFMETLVWAATGLVPGLTGSHLGLPADAVAWDFNAPGAVPGAAGGVRFTQAVQEMALTGPVSYGTRLIDGFGAPFKARLRQAFGSALSVSAIAEVIPDARSRITLHGTETDAHGLPLPVIQSVLTDNSLTLLRFMAAKGRTLLQSAGVGSVLEQATSWDMFGATHVFGTARMGHDAAQSVVNDTGRCHDHANLWIADASVFPSSGGGESPSLTIQALALRTARAIAAG